MSGETQKIFFSYAHEDSDFALKLAKELRVAGADLWVDKLDIRGGMDWDDAVGEALEACPCMLVVLSPDSVASRNVKDEVSYALEEGKQVIPVLYRPCKRPFRLRRVQYVDFTGDYEAGFAQLLRDLRIEQPSVAVAPPEPEAAGPVQAQDEVVSREVEEETRGAAPVEIEDIEAPMFGNTGGGQSHNNMQPYTTLNFCIALQGLFPSRN